MAIKLLLLVSAAILVFGIINETSAQFRHGGYGYGYGHQSYPHYQQPGYQRPAYGGYQQTGYQQQLPDGVSLQEAEWVCKNPKTGDMMIITTEDDPSTNTATNVQQQWQTQPTNPQPSFAPPTFPQPTPSYPIQNPQTPSQDAPNTNGDGLIDIRMRD